MLQLVLGFVLTGLSKEVELVCGANCCTVMLKKEHNFLVMEQC